MVVGDRLWLFSQAVHPQPMINNNSVPMSMRGVFGTNVQSLPPTTSQSTLMPSEHSQCNLIPSEHSMNYNGFNKQDSLYRHFLSGPMKPYESFASAKYDKDHRNFSNMHLPPPNQSKPLFKKNFLTVDNESNEKIVDSYRNNNFHLPHHLLGNKNIAKSVMMQSTSVNSIDAAMTHNDEIGGIAELERAFGLNDKCNRLLNPESNLKQAVARSERNGIQDGSEYFSSENSDIDCEELNDS